MSTINKILAGAVMLQSTILCDAANRVAKREYGKTAYGTLVGSLAMATIAAPHAAIAAKLWFHKEKDKTEVDHSQKYFDHYKRYMKRYRSGEYSLYQFTGKLVELMYRHPANAFVRAYVYTDLADEAPEVLDDLERNSMAFNHLIWGIRCYDNHDNDARNAKNDASLLVSFNDAINRAVTLIDESYQDELSVLLHNVGEAFSNTVSKEALDKFEEAVSDLLARHDEGSKKNATDFPGYKTSEDFLAIAEAKEGLKAYATNRGGAYTFIGKFVREHPRLNTEEILQQLQDWVEYNTTDDAAKYLSSFIEDIYAFRFKNWNEAWSFYQTFKSTYDANEASDEFEHLAEDAFDDVFGANRSQTFINHEAVVDHYAKRIKCGFHDKDSAWITAKRIASAAHQMKMTVSDHMFADMLKVKYVEAYGLDSWL